MGSGGPVPKKPLTISIQKGTLENFQPLGPLGTAGLWKGVATEIRVIWPRVWEWEAGATQGAFP